MQVASPAPRPAGTTPAAEQHAPDADPQAIRARLTPDVAAVFDREWEFVLEEAKLSKDLSGVRDLLGKWRLFAHQESIEPGSYFRVLATAARIQASGRPEPGSASADEMRALIRRRLDEAGQGR